MRQVPGNGSRLRKSSPACMQRLEPRRLLSAGAVDTTFGAGGRQITQFEGSTPEFAFGAVTQPDGKVVVAGGGGSPAGSSQFLIARYNSDGSLDSSFANGGVQAIPVGAFDQAWDVALQSDGKIIVAGETETHTTPFDFGVVRLNPDGSLDTTFNGTGMRTIDFGGNADVAYGVAIQSDGRIVLAGSSTPTAANSASAVALVRLNTDGNLDSSFGTGGKVTTTVPAAGNDAAHAVMIDSVGRIVITGSAGLGNFHFLAGRLNPDGSPDPTFGTNGFVVTPLSATIDSSLGVAAAPGGKIVASGWASNPATQHDFAAVRYNSDGTLDATFGNGGKAIIDINHQYEDARHVAVLPDGRVLLVGSTQPSIFNNTVNSELVRLNADGTLDTTFNGTGDAVMIPGELWGLTLAPDGTATGVGGINSPGGRLTDFLVARYTPDGALDPSFGQSGWVTTDIPGPNISRAQAVALQPDGKVVVAGWADIGEGGGISDFALARYNADGSPDTTFGNNGQVTTDFAGLGDRAAAVAIQPDGEIVVAGSGGPLNTGGFAVARYFSDGQIDTSFGDGGMLVINGFPGANGQQATALALQPDGSIVMAGTAFNGGQYGAGILLARLTSWGTLDASFNGTGRLYTPLTGGQGGSVQALSIDSTGHLIVGGTFITNFSGDQFMLARYNADGTADATFGVNGIVKAAPGGSADLSAIDLGPGDSIVAAGSFSSSSATGFALARFNTNGSIDTTFGIGGMVTTPFSAGGASGVRVLPDGSVLAAGNSGSNVALAHYTTSGVLDPAFGTGGKVTTNLGDYSVYAYGLAVRPDGTIVVAGGDVPAQYQTLDMMVAQFVGISPLRVTAAAFNYQSNPSSLNFTFSEDVSASISSTSIQVTDLTSGQTVNPAQENYDPATKTATFSFTGVLPSGRYQARLQAQSLTDANQIQLDGNGDGRPGGDYIYNFFSLTGDVNHDAAVNFADLLTLAQNYGSKTATFAQGDLNYDGVVNFADLLILAQNYGQTLAAAAGASPAGTFHTLEKTLTASAAYQKRVRGKRGLAIDLRPSPPRRPT